jgi:hypothetical protein
VHISISGKLTVVPGHGAHHRAQGGGLAHHVLIKRAVRFDVTDVRALATADAFQRADLVEHQVFDFLCRAVHRATAKADQVLVGGVCTDAYVVGHGQGHGLAHHAGIRGVEAAGDVGAVDIRHDLGVQTHGPGAEAFADVAIQKQAVQVSILIMTCMDVVRQLGAVLRCGFIFPLPPEGVQLIKTAAGDRKS